MFKIDIGIISALYDLLDLPSVFRINVTIVYIELQCWVRALLAV